jgi:hypothetical protein
MDTSKSLVSFPYKTFSERLINSMKIMIFFVIALTIVMCLSSSTNSEIIISLLVGFVIFIFYFLEHRKWSRYYITDIFQLTGNKIKIIYYDKDDRKEYITENELLKINKKFVWYKRGRVPYLIFQNNNDNFKIKQYEVDSWDETAIDNIAKNNLED